jgi:hypothetical protein
MARGATAPIGAERCAKNGYWYTKTEAGKWVLTHWLTAEKKLGRPLADNEMVQFVDAKYKSDPKNPSGIRIVRKKTSSLRTRKSYLEDRIKELQAELRSVNEQLKKIE